MRNKGIGAIRTLPGSNAENSRPRRLPATGQRCSHKTRQQGSTIMSIRSIALSALAVPAFACVVLTATPSLPQQLPSGGAVTNGTATIATPQGGTLNINQTSNRAIIDWNSF